MIVALYILIALVVTGAVLYILHRRDMVRNDADSGDAPTSVSDRQDTEEQCCGMHITCERDSLLSTVSESIEYYDDEELDRFKGRSPDSYTAEETEEFRNVLLTLLPHDIAGWGRSIQLRDIELPDEIREELLMIVAEARAKAAASSS